MDYESSYKVDLSEFRDEVTITSVICKTSKIYDIWECELKDDPGLSLNSRELKSINKVVRGLFQKEIETQYGPSSFHWAGDKISPLLHLKIGDVVKYSGKNHEIVYVLPESEKCGLKSREGKLLNNIHFSEIQIPLLKKDS